MAACHTTARQCCATVQSECLQDMGWATCHATEPTHIHTYIHIPLRAKREERREKIRTSTSGTYIFWLMWRFWLQLCNVYHISLPPVPSSFCALAKHPSTCAIVTYKSCLLSVRRPPITVHVAASVARKVFSDNTPNALPAVGQLWRLLQFSDP